MNLECILLHPAEPTRSENRDSRATNSKVTELATKSKEWNEGRIITSDAKWQHSRFFFKERSYYCCDEKKVCWYTDYLALGKHLFSLCMRKSVLLRLELYCISYGYLLLYCTSTDTILWFFNLSSLIVPCQDPNS